MGIRKIVILKNYYFTICLKRLETTTKRTMSSHMTGIVFLWQNSKIANVFTMRHLLSCKINLNTAYVKFRFLDGSMVSIDTIAVENEW